MPERIPLHWGDSLSFTSTLAEFGLRYRLVLQIAYGQFVASAVVETGPDDPYLLRNSISGDVAKVVDLAGYLYGMSFDVDVISAACNDGRVVVFGNAIPVLTEARRDGPKQLEGDLFSAVLADIPSHIVLADFREAMRNPVGTGFFCYRAIEAMMQSMKTDASDPDGPAWEILRNRLQIHRSAIEAIKSHADYPRHGRIASVTNDERVKIFRITDEIIRRYLEYLRVEKKPLADSEFPLLKYPA
jgi:hypothetical protein